MSALPPAAFPWLLRASLHTSLDRRPPCPGPADPPPPTYLVLLRCCCRSYCADFKEKEKMHHRF